MIKMIKEILKKLYSKKIAHQLSIKINKKINKLIKKRKKEKWDEKDIALIIYPDAIHQSGSKPLKALANFLKKYLDDTFTIIHLLPFFPYSSDRGFSVIDFYQVNSAFGSWQDIKKISKKYRLMSDLILNHISAKSQWFKNFQQGIKKYQNFFLHFKKSEIPVEELKKVFRPRPTPLLTPFKTKFGERYVWTTFSTEKGVDQIDLNYKNPQVIWEMIKIFIFLAKKGVKIFRLDAITYLWKEIGTNCKHLPQNHLIVSLFRKILQQLIPDGLIITETNVPHQENISYFGNGKNEAHLVYNFALPPLVLYSFIKGDATHLTRWAKKLIYPSPSCTYFNFLDSHDGIGILGAKEFLNKKQINQIFSWVKKQGGQLSYRNLPNGQQTVYEMNITWWSALNNDTEPFSLQLKKFITSKAISFALKGIPAVYYLSLFGQKNDDQLYQKTKIKRDINRTNYSSNELEEKLTKKSSREKLIFKAMVNLIKERKKLKAFHPQGEQKILNLDKKVFAIVRQWKKEKVFAVHNVSNSHVAVNYQNLKVNLSPYEYRWQKL